MSKEKIECPFGCDNIYERCELDTHKLKCDYYTIKCPFSCFGYKDEIRKKEELDNIAEKFRQMHLENIKKIDNQHEENILTINNNFTLKNKEIDNNQIVQLEKINNEKIQINNKHTEEMK